MEEESKSVENEVAVTEPIIINLGKQKKKRLKKLLKGRGKLLDEIEEVIVEVTSMLDDEEVDGKVILPVVLVYREKPKRKKSLGILGF